MKLRYLPFSLLFVFCTNSFLSAQTTAVEIETLLETDAVTYSAAARFVLSASETLATSDSDEAFRYAAERNWLTKKAAPDASAQLDEIALLIMHSFNISGGLFYSIIKNPHYAYRELVYRQIIQGRADPHMNVSGERLLFITNRVFSIIVEKQSAGGNQHSAESTAEVNAIPEN